MAATARTPASLDALPPPDMASKAETVGEAKAALPAATMFALGVLAGAFIAMGAAFSTTVTAGTGDVAFGVVRLLAGLAFSLGLILVIVGGAELFTGNTLMIMAWAGRRISTAALLRNWAIVYAGNMAGAFAAALTIAAHQDQPRLRPGGRAGHPLQRARLHRRMAVLLGPHHRRSRAGDRAADRRLRRLGFEHSVANMYVIPVALLIKRDQAWVDSAAGLPDLHTLTWHNYLVDNLLPVTIGNIIGGTLLVGAIYWFVYLRERGSTSDGATRP
jgi:formate transporter